MRDVAVEAAPGTSDTGRFAPSPTGELHLGNLRTALLAWLFARAQRHRFLVRIEDLDPDRVVADMEQQHLDDLAALGLDWDEPPVRQTDRLDLYRDALRRLERAGLLYRCYCTRAEIREAASAPHGAAVDGAYPGTCAALSGAQIAAHERAGRSACLRARAEGAVLAYRDRLLGIVEGYVDDFVVMRKDGVPAYNLAVVVDDDAQNVTEVVRGADLAETTPRQLWLARALELPAPSHAHVPLLLGADGARLSKRHGSVTLAQLAAEGTTVDAVRSRLAASLGLAERGEPVTAAQLVERFDPAALPTEPERFVV